MTLVLYRPGTARKQPEVCQPSTLTKPPEFAAASLWSNCDERDLSQISPEGPGIGLFKSPEYLLEFFASQLRGDTLTQHLAKVRGHGQVPAFLELALLQAGPAPVD